MPDNRNNQISVSKLKSLNPEKKVLKPGDRLNIH